MLSDGSYIQIARDQKRCWILRAPAAYRIAGMYFHVLYQLNAGGYVILDFVSERMNRVTTPEGDAELWLVERPPNARRVGDEEALDFLIEGQFPILEELQPVLEQKSKKAGKRAAPKPPRRLEYWVEKSPFQMNANQPADPPRALETTDSILELAEIAVQTVRSWQSQNRDQRDYIYVWALANRLFSQFRVERSDWWGPKDRVPQEYVGLLELRWPDGSDSLRRTLVEMRELIAAPAAALVATRFTLGHPDVPTTEEREAAENALIDSLEQLEQAVVRLRAEYDVLKSGANVEELRDKPVTRKPPSEDAFLAYRLKVLSGSTQKQIATALATLRGITPDQGTVSRWIKDVEEWIGAGNVLPDIDWSMAKKAQSIDPKEIDKGANLERRTPRQRRSRDDS